MTPDEFIAAIGPAAHASELATGVPAHFTIAQAALESGWGSSKSAQLGFNLFGVKADKSWHGPTFLMRTREYVNGKMVVIDALWRKYGSWQESIDNRAKFLMENPRYRDAFKHKDAEGFAVAIAAAGYATDPSYAKLIISIIRSHRMEAA